MAGAVIGQVAGGVSGVPQAAAAAGVPYTTARGWVRRFARRAAELAVSFPALCIELGGEGGPAAAGPVPARCRGGIGGVHGRGAAARMGRAGAVAVRQRGDRRQPAGGQRILALPDHRQAAFHASQEPVMRRAP